MKTKTLYAIIFFYDLKQVIRDGLCDFRSAVWVISYDHSMTKAWILIISLEGFLQ